MKNIKYKLGILIVALMLFSILSCKKSFVDIIPQGLVPVSTYYASEIDIKNALTGAYNSLRPVYNNQWAFAELPSDNTQTVGETEAAWGEQDKLSWIASSTNIQAAWARYYTSIAYCNLVLDHIGPVPMTETNRNSYIGQAKFLRALMYFNLVRMFGGVPLVLNEITSESQAYSYDRAPVAEVYAQIEADLTAAGSVLPSSYTGVNVGRATSIAAKALLGKVYLFENKFPEAESKLAEIIPSAPSPLISYDQVFGLGRDNNAEIIFSIQYLTGGFSEGNTFASGFVPQLSGTTIIGVTATSLNLGSKDLYNSFEPGDLRFNVSIGAFSSGSTVYYYAKKLIYSTVPSGSEGDNDWPVLRWGDVILMYAEALNENNRTPEALIQLNKVRTRAGLTPKLNLTKVDARIAIQKDRRIELCFEGERWFDLIRWNIFIPVMEAFKTNYPPTSGAFANIVPELSLFPIPTRERSLNPNLSQNPGY